MNGAIFWLDGYRKASVLFGVNDLHLFRLLPAPCCPEGDGGVCNRIAHHRDGAAQSVANAGFCCLLATESSKADADPSDQQPSMQCGLEHHDAYGRILFF